MALKKATIEVTPYITVSGTLMTMAMLIDPPAPGKQKVLCNGKIFEGKLLGQPIPMEIAYDKVVKTLAAEADAELTA